MLQGIATSPQPYSFSKLHGSKENQRWVLALVLYVAAVISLFDGNNLSFLFTPIRFKDAVGFYSPAFFRLLMKALFRTKETSAEPPLFWGETQGFYRTGPWMDKDVIFFVSLRAPPYLWISL